MNIMAAVVAMTSDILAMIVSMMTTNAESNSGTLVLVHVHDIIVANIIVEVVVAVTVFAVSADIIAASWPQSS